jgi:hypothetical protein
MGGIGDVILDEDDIKSHHLNDFGMGLTTSEPPEEFR